MPAHKIQFTEAEQFFYDHAGFSYRKDAETPASGRARCAILLAEAELGFYRSSAEMVWEIDQDADTEPAEGYFVSGCEQWVAILMRDGSALASLGGIDFGKDDADPEREPYGRVIRAELAAEARL